MNLKHGQGVFYYPDGSKYDGEFLLYVFFFFKVRVEIQGECMHNTKCLCVLLWVRLMGGRPASGSWDLHIS